MLQERETALLSELQQLEDTYKGEGVDRQVDQLRITKEQNIATLTDNENQAFLQQIIAQLDARMRELEASLETARDRMRRVELEWDTNLPIKVAGKHRKKTSSTGEFNKPGSITIDYETNNIFICDVRNDRVQVFNKSMQFQFMFSAEMCSPSGMFIYSGKVYITQLGADSLTVYSTDGKYAQSVGSYGKGELEFDWPTAVTVSEVNNSVYVSD